MIYFDDAFFCEPNCQIIGRISKTIFQDLSEVCNVFQTTLNQ